MIGSDVANLTASRGAGDFGGRANAGKMGVMGGWRGWGVLGTETGEREGLAWFGMNDFEGGTLIIMGAP
jgi:hypothetical protein